jgi:hypothetical protein
MATVAVVRATTLEVRARKPNATYALAPKRLCITAYSSINPAAVERGSKS